MTARNRKGFTLVELLVVIVIITMLVGLLVPAVQSARAKARLAQCTNNQHEIGLAILQYEGAKKHYPGYVNKIGTGAIGNNDPRMPLSWATVLLPELGREDLWRGWRELRRDDPAYAVKFAELQVRMPQLFCPTDSSEENTALSYAGNCGLPDNNNNNPPDSACNGVFHNLYRTDNPMVASSSIRDGTQQTILLSENIQAGLWYIDPNQGAIEPDVGINWVWVDYADRQNPTANERPTDVASYINGCKDGCEAHPTVDSRPMDPLFARPSSNHPGGVLITYCDGHQQFLNERINYITYQHLMTPDDQRAGLCVQVQDGEFQE
jgi:prepilin-type N-terminal cleavage/methylation domain-containing protein